MRPRSLQEHPSVAERDYTNFSQVSVGQVADLIYAYAIGLKCGNIFVETDRM